MTTRICRIVAGKETVNRLKFHLSRMDAASRALFEMKCIAGKTDGEIAGILGVEKNTIAVRIHRMKKRLWELMAEEGYTDV